MANAEVVPERTHSLTIKNPTTCRLIRKLADQTGETMTQAVTVAVQEPFKLLDHGEWLYDEKGLPR